MSGYRPQNVTADKNLHNVDIDLQGPDDLDELKPTLDANPYLWKEKVYIYVLYIHQ